MAPTCKLSTVDAHVYSFGLKTLTAWMAIICRHDTNYCSPMHLQVRLLGINGFTLSWKSTPANNSLIMKASVFTTQQRICHAFHRSHSLSSSIMVMVMVVDVESVAWGKPGLVPTIDTVNPWSPSNTVSVTMVIVAHTVEGGPPTGNTTVAGTGSMKSSGSAAGYSCWSNICTVSHVTLNTYYGKWLQM